MQKLYKKKDFRDNCGFGLIASIDGVKSRKIITDSINALISMTHRGGIGSDGKTGDGCGLLVDINETYYKDLIYKEQKIDLDESFAIGQMFYFDQIEKLLPRIKKILKDEKLKLITYREVPIDKNVLGDIALKCLPNIYQIFISPANKNLSENQFQTSLLQSRKLIEEIYLNDEKLYFCSFSSKTIIYKGLMLPKDIKSFYIDLKSKDFISAICVFHQRFSTNTTPRWHLAQPFRFLAHNGEINAIRGNRNWVKARSSIFKTPLIPKLKKFKQIVNEDGSDSSALDNMLEILVKGGLNIFRSIRMLLPQLGRMLNY